MYVIHLTNLHLPTFAVLYIKQSVRVANTATFQPQKNRCSQGSTKKNFTEDS
jgi:hypothetical protein